MDTASEQKLQEIVAKEPAALTEPDKEFLKARASYLTDEDRAKFAEVLGEPAEKPKRGKKDSE